MADISNPTSNVSIYNEAGTLAEVTDDNELKVADLANITSGGFARQEKLYTFPYEFTLSNGDENDIILITNPSGSGMNLRFYKVQLGVIDNVTVIWRMYYDPTITANGTTQTPTNTVNGSSETSDVELYTIPTISARGTESDVIIASQGNTRIELDFGFVLQPGESCLMTFESIAANKDFAADLIWAEEAI